MPDENKNGESSTPEELDAASDAALAASDFARYQEVENARQLNKPIPEAPAPSTQTTEPPPASEPGTAQPIQEKKPKGAEERKKELADDIAALLKQRADLKAEIEGAKPGEKKVEPPPTKEPEKKAEPVKAEPKAGEEPKEPKLEDFATFAEFNVADRKYVRELAAFEALKTITAHDAERDAASANKVLADAWLAKRTAAAEEHADYADVAFSKETPISDVMDGWILSNPAGARVLYRLGENGSAEGKRIFALGPYDQVEALIDIKNSLTTPETKTPPVKKHTAAPPPAENLSGKNTDLADPSAAALAAGDFSSYMARENAREFKARR